MHESLERRYIRAMAEARDLQRRHSELQEHFRNLLERSRSGMARDLMLVTAGIAQHRRPQTSIAKAQQDRLAARIKIVARVHERFDNGPAFPAHHFLRDVCADIAAAAGSPAVKVRFEAEPVPIDFAQAVPLGLVASELMFNAYDHAFRRQPQGALFVRLQARARGAGRLTVADTGDGLPLPFVKGPGLGIVESLVASMEGTVMYKPGPGAQVDVDFSAWRERGRPTSRPKFEIQGLLGSPLATPLD